MSNHIVITPKVFSIFIFAYVTSEAGAFLNLINDFKIPQELLIEAQNRATNLAIQYAAIATLVR